MVVSGLQEGKLQHPSIYLASACVTFADAPLATGSHVAKARVKVGGATQDMGTRRHNSLEVITVRISQRVWNIRMYYKYNLYIPIDHCKSPSLYM